MNCFAKHLTIHSYTYCRYSLRVDTGNSSCQSGVHLFFCIAIKTGSSSIKEKAL